MLTPEDKAKVTAHVAAAWTERDGGCPMCGCSKWEAHGYVNLVLAETPLIADAPAPRGFPCAALTCFGCGYVALLNLLRAGVTPAV